MREKSGSVEQGGTFWDHLDVLRGTILRSLAFVAVLMVLLFCFKGFLFDSVVLAPTDGEFFLYRWLDGVLRSVGLSGLQSFSIQIVNIELSAQFFLHVKTAFFSALVLSMPFVIYQIWLFVAPALYEGEKRACRGVFLMASLLFYTGVVIGYSVVFPLTLRFLGTYQVSGAIPNQISLSSYISTFLSLILVMGIVFEIPAVSWLLSRLGVIDRKMLAGARKYAVVTALILAAIITPSGDAFTMVIVAFPLYFLYELSILLCRKQGGSDRKEV